MNEALETELASVRAEQRRLARAVALADDVPELASELRQRAVRIQHLQAEIAAARRTPEELGTIIEKVEARCREQIGDLRTALADRADLREVFLTLFPDGLVLTPEWAQDDSGNGRRSHLRRRRGSDPNASFPVPPGNRRVWRAKGAVRLADPVALRPQRDLILKDLMIPFDFLLLRHLCASLMRNDRDDGGRTSPSRGGT